MCWTVVVQEHGMTCAGPRVQCNSKRTLPSHFTLHSSHPALHTSHLHFTSSQLISSELFSSHVMSSHMSAKFFFHSFHFIWAQLNPLISPKLVSTHLGSSARQKAWDTDAFTQKRFYKILCTTKLAQSTSQYYFALQSLHRVLPSTTLYGYTKYSQHALSFTHSNLLHTAIFYKEKLLHTTSFYTRQAFAHSNLWQKPFHSAIFSHRRFYTELPFTHHSFTHRSLRSFYTQQAFTHSKLLHTASFDTQQAFTDSKLLHTASFYTQQPWCRHTNAIHNSQLQELIVLRRQPHERGTLTQPLQCDLQALNCETQKNCAQRRQKLQLQNLSAPKGKITILMNFHTEKIYWKITIAAAPIRFTTLSCKGQ